MNKKIKIMKEELRQKHSAMKLFSYAECNTCKQVYYRHSTTEKTTCAGCGKELKWIPFEDYLDKIIEYFNIFKIGTLVQATEKFIQYDDVYQGAIGRIIEYFPDLTYPFKVKWQGKNLTEDYDNEIECSIYEIQVMEKNEKWMQFNASI